LCRFKKGPSKKWDCQKIEMVELRGNIGRESFPEISLGLWDGK
jgi:hypothetical protein